MPPFLFQKFANKTLQKDIDKFTWRVYTVLVHINLGIGDLL